MKRFVAVTAVLVFAAGCSQLTTSDKEVAAMDQQAAAIGDEYVECVKSEAQKRYGTVDTYFLVDAARKACEAKKDEYIESRSAFFAAQYMIYDEPLERSVNELEARVDEETTAMFAADTPPSVAAGSSAAAAPAAAATATAAAAPATWNADQRVYLDCMEDQALRYAGLDESAANIADVAASRCRSYLTEANRSALEAEGRAAVMGAVMDARLKAP